MSYEDARHFYALPEGQLPIVRRQFPNAAFWRRTICNNGITLTPVRRDV
jgi:hypothetical protein